MPSGSRPRSPTTGDIMVALAVATGSVTAWTYFYRPLNLAVVTAVTVLLYGSCLLWPRIRQAPPRPAVLVIAALVSAAVVLRFPPQPNATLTRWHRPSVLISGYAALALGLAAAFIWARSKRAAVDAGAAGLLLAALGAALAVPGGLRPEIDVWALLQAATTAVVRGQNVYAMDFTNVVPAGQTAACYTYLPGSFLLTIPGRWLGDVRWAEVGLFLAGVLTAAVVLARRRAPATAVLTLVLAVVVPVTLRVVQQSWTDTLLVGLLAIALACWRSVWVVLPLGLAMATKQHVALLIPLLAIWLGWRRTLGAAALGAAIAGPFLLADPVRGFRCTVTYFFEVPTYGTAISLWSVLPDGWRSPLLVLVTIGLAYLVAGWRLPRTPAGFAVAAALVLAGFSIVNKLSYPNQWWLVAELMLLSAAFTPRLPPEPVHNQEPNGRGSRGKRLARPTARFAGPS